MRKRYFPKSFVREPHPCGLSIAVVGGLLRVVSIGRSWAWTYGEFARRPHCVSQLIHPAAADPQCFRRHHVAVLVAITPSDSKSVSAAAGTGPVNMLDHEHQPLTRTCRDGRWAEITTSLADRQERRGSSDKQASKALSHV
jgi:hypothetical protein